MVTNSRGTVDCYAADGRRGGHGPTTFTFPAVVSERIVSVLITVAGSAGPGRVNRVILHDSCRSTNLASPEQSSVKPSTPRLSVVHCIQFMAAGMAVLLALVP
jgi:hypothetical protein